MLASTASKEYFVDRELHVYEAEISVFLRRVKAAKDQLEKLWDNENNCASKISRSIREKHGLDDSTIRQSLKTTAIISLYSALKDNQSKCLAKLLKLYKKGPMEKVLVGLYEPLLADYFQYYHTEIKRLAVNRNNYYAHISKQEITNQILSWDEVPGKFRILSFSDIIGNNPQSLFSLQSLNYLSGIIFVLNFAQEKEVFRSMVNDIPGHLISFRDIYKLS